MRSTRESAAPFWDAPLREIDDADLAAALRDLFVNGAAEARQLLAGGLPVLVVLVSRRLSCVYDMLLEAGMDVFADIEVVSDRALDGDLDLRGRRVLLLDDCLILGTTLVDLFDEVVERAGQADQVTAHVAAVDEERYSPALAAHLSLGIGTTQGPLLCSTKQLEAFAHDVARALYRAGIPYFTDFPVVRDVQMDRSSLDALLRSTSWYCADVSAPRAFGGTARRAWSLVPRADTLARLRSRAAPDALALAQLWKVRIYAYFDGERANFHLVPIGIPGAASERQLERARSAIQQECMLEPTSTDDRHATVEARHRFLQMYLSSCLLAEFWSQFEHFGLPPLDSSRLDQGPLGTYYGPDGVGRALAAFDGAFAAYRSAAGDRDAPLLAPFDASSGLGSRREVRRSVIESRLVTEATAELAAAGIVRAISTAVVPCPPAPGEIRRVDLLWVRNVLHVFGYVDRELERPQERELKALSYPAYRDYRDEGSGALGDRVLRQGITLYELTELLLPDVDLADPWWAAVTSFAIDIGNDCGVAVPTTARGQGGRVFRQYRSGEVAFAVASAPAEEALHRPEVRAFAECTDRFFEDIVEERTDAADVRFDVLRVVAHALRGPLAQAWSGRVTEVTPPSFRAVVESQVDRGDSDVALLPLSVFDEHDRTSLARGTEFDWYVFDARDELGKPLPSARFRLAVAG